MSETSAQSNDGTDRLAVAKLIQKSGAVSAVSTSHKSLFTVTSRRTGTVAIRITPRDSKPEIDTAK